MQKQPRHLRPPLINISKVLEYFAEESSKSSPQKPVFCVQVGANDGKNNDPIHKYIVDYNWRGLLIEPQKNVFENELKKTYAGNKNVTLVNCAIAPKSEKKKLYKIAFTDARWATGLSSFDLGSLQHHIDTGYVDVCAQKNGIALPTNKADYIKTEDVDAKSFQDLFENFKIADVDLLAIDTEGYDFEVLKMFNFERARPDVVLFESKNLSPEDFKTSSDHMRQLGYAVFWQKGDTLAISPKLLARIGFLRKTLWAAEALLKKI